MSIDRDKISKAKKILFSLGIIYLIAGFFTPQLITLLGADLYIQWGLGFILDYLIIIQIAVIIGAILVIIGALILTSNRTLGKTLIIIGCIPGLKDIGFIILIVTLFIVKKAPLK